MFEKNECRFIISASQMLVNSAETLFGEGKAFERTAS